ncbi:MAG: hypothetical protein IPN17_32795 [Deltaproteobacteria bacterium]|nr:hypothetical protein [Deltaproteobacteria bacterium]
MTRTRTLTVDPSPPVAGGSTKATVAALRRLALVAMRALSNSASSSPGKAARSSESPHSLPPRKSCRRCPALVGELGMRVEGSGSPPISGMWQVWQVCGSVRRAKSLCAHSV